MKIGMLSKRIYKDNDKIGEPFIYIDDNSQRGIKIRKGHDFRIDNDTGELIIRNTKGRFDLDAFTKKIKQKKATLNDIQDYILK